MDYRSLAKDAGTAFLAQGVAMGLSFLQALFVPKLLGVTQYGYWQLFLFYTSYVGFAHLGLNDGVYLLKGGQPRSVIDKRSVNSQFAIGVALELMFAVAVIAVAFFGECESDRRFVIICTGIFLVIQNLASFLSYLLQAMGETRRFSYSVIVERLTFLVPLLFFLITKCQSYQFFVVAYTLSCLIRLVYCAWFCRDFISSGFESLPIAVSETWASIRVGFKLMVANIASQLILGGLRLCIDAVWGIDVFGELSFSLSLVNFFLVFISQVSMVLFPALRQVDLSEVKVFFSNTRDFMSLFFPSIYLFYYPAVWLLSLWLPEYASSFAYFALLIPVCVFDGKMNVCCTTLLKVLREEELLLKINALACISSLLFVLMGVFGLSSAFAAIGGVVVAIIGRDLCSEILLARKLEVGYNRVIVIGELLLTFLFVSSAMILPEMAAIAVYFFAYVAFLFIFRRRAGELLGKILGIKLGR